MKRLLLLIAVALLASGVNAQWVSNGPDSAVVECLAVSGTSVFAGTVREGIFLSTDSGGSWTAVNTGLPFGSFAYVSSMAVSNANVFAGTVGGGIFLSTNNGGSWSAVNTGLTTNRVFALMVYGPSVFASTDSGVFISNNNGGNWSAANSGITRNVGSFASGNGIIYAATDTTVYSSTNSGSSWTAATDTGIFGTPFYSLAVSGQQLYSGTYSGGVFLSYDNGDNWITESTFLPLVGYVSSIVFYNDTNIFVSEYGGGVYFITTTDIDSSYGGWNQVGNVLPNAGVSSLAVMGNYLFAGTAGSGVWQFYLPTIIFDGIPEVSAPVNGEFSLYPNPNSVGIVRCVVGNELLDGKMEIYDLAGQLVLSQTIENSKTGIDVSTLAAGMYVVNVTGATETESRKLVIAK